MARVFRNACLEARPSITTMSRLWRHEGNFRFLYHPLNAQSGQLIKAHGLPLQRTLRATRYTFSATSQASPFDRPSEKPKRADQVLWPYGLADHELLPNIWAFAFAHSNAEEVSISDEQQRSSKVSAPLFADGLLLHVGSPGREHMTNIVWILSQVVSEWQARGTYQAALMITWKT